MPRPRQQASLNRTLPRAVESNYAVAGLRDETVLSQVARWVGSASHWVGCVDYRSAPVRHYITLLKAILENQQVYPLVQQRLGGGDAVRTGCDEVSV